ncbi:S41 family peptidase [Tissierella sp. Yu-01]|uniref:S41 family peptidase n=1 Tax=Tissierella sp. Yu-01 TaxID=3035694 RepID=UPI00240E15AB|nr:S41 family peptidase [Tissierella sp. Yu-01]WFA08521.1 S41 family peptidase [Tissierella sp. Yu-01]
MSKKLLILLLAITLLIPSAAFAESALPIDLYQREADLLFLIDAFQYIKGNYPFEVEDDQLIEGGLKGMLQTLDPYSDYYTPEESGLLYDDILGQFTGIGVYIEEKNSYINIVDTIKGAPSEEAGLKKDDLIVSVDGVDIKGMPADDVTSMIKGQEGTKVRLGILRNNKTKPIYIEVMRKEVEINPVEYEVIEKNIGYIKLSEFTQSSTKEMKSALKELDKVGINKIILDLRNNPGGLLDKAIEISRLFVPKGPVVHIKEKGKALTTYSSFNENPKYEIVLLVNRNSASASEIVAGAVRDTKSGILIGQKTFGKGIVQSMIPLSNGGILKMTTAEYLTPNKTSIHGIGIIPDIQVENTLEEDLQLKEAIKAFK